MRRVGTVSPDQIFDGIRRYLRQLDDNALEAAIARAENASDATDRSTLRKEAGYAREILAERRRKRA